MRHALRLGITILVGMAMGACASSSTSTVGAVEGGSKVPVEGHDGGADSTLPPIAVRLPSEPEVDRLTQAEDVASFGDGFVAVYTASRLAFGSDDKYALHRLSADGEVVWSQVLAGQALITSSANGKVVASATKDTNGGMLQIFGAGGLEQTVAIEGRIRGLGVMPSGAIVAKVTVYYGDAPSPGTTAYGFPVGPHGIDVLLVDALSANPKATLIDDPKLLDLDCPIAVDEKGNTWTGGHRIDANGGVSLHGIPANGDIIARPGGGAWLAFTSSGDEPGLNAALQGHACPKCIAEVDADGAVMKVLGTFDDFGLRSTPEDTRGRYWGFAPVSGALWAFTTESFPNDRDTLVLGPPGTPLQHVRSTHKVEPLRLRVIDGNAWLVGGFSGHLPVFDMELRGGTSWQAPFALRFPKAAAVASLGSGAEAQCTAFSEECRTCMADCRQATYPQCLSDADCIAALDPGDLCICLAPEESDGCLVTDGGTEAQRTKYAKAMQCYAGACRATCGL